MDNGEKGNRHSLKRILGRGLRAKDRGKCATSHAQWVEHIIQRVQGGGQQCAKVQTMFLKKKQKKKKTCSLESVVRKKSLSERVKGSCRRNDSEGT